MHQIVLCCGVIDFAGKFAALTHCSCFYELLRRRREVCGATSSALWRIPLNESIIVISGPDCARINIREFVIVYRRTSVRCI